MKKHIWIMNHYAAGMYFNQGGRHYWFAKYLKRKGYGPVVFSCNTKHGVPERYIDTEDLWIERNAEEIDVPFIFVKSNLYTGNGKQRIFNMIGFYRNVKKAAKEYAEIHGKPDIIYASSVHPLTLVAGIQLAKFFEVKCICEVRDLWPETLVAMGRIKRNSIPAKILYSLEKFIYKKADILIFTFPGGKDYVESIGLDNSKVRYINNGVDIEEYNLHKEKSIYEDSDLNVENSFKVLYTGSMGQANELSYLIKAAQIIKRKNINDIKFFLFGDGYQRKELEQYVKENNLDNVVFKGRVEKEYIPNILSKGNLNVFTGKHINLYKYGLSLNKMFDYFASGRPTLSNIECGYDMLEGYGCGITVKGGSPNALADGILKFYNMPKQEYNIYCQNSIKAAEDFDFKVLTDKLENK